MEHLEIRTYGGRKDRADVTILVPHDASIDDLSRGYPDIYRNVVQAMEPPLSTIDAKKPPRKNGQTDGDARYEARELEKERHQKNRENTESRLRKLLTIEQDVFATEAATQIAGTLLEEGGKDIRVEVIKILIPRLIVDMNRIEAKAFPQIFSHEQHPDILRDLRSIYRSTRHAIAQRLRQANILIDLHTMSPTNPWGKIEVQPNNHQEFIDTWRQNPASPRVNDIITRRKDQAGNSHPLGDPALINALKQEFERAGIPHGFSNTFELNDEILGTAWAELVRSYVGLDLTKENGSRERVGDKKFDLSELTLDAERLRKITKPVGLAIADVVRRRSKEPRMVV